MITHFSRAVEGVAYKVVGQLNPSKVLETLEGLAKRDCLPNNLVCRSSTGTQCYNNLSNTLKVFDKFGITLLIIRNSRAYTITILSVAMIRI